MKVFKFLIVAIIFFVAGFFVGQGYDGIYMDKCLTQTPEDLRSVTLVLQFSETEVMEIQNAEVPQSQTILDLLTVQLYHNELDFETKDYGELGVLVQKIGDKENGQDNKYWQYWVDGEQIMIGANSYILKGGERIEWRFAESEF